MFMRVALSGFRFRLDLGDFFKGAKGGNSPVGRTQVRDPTAKPEVGRGLLGEWGFRGFPLLFAQP